MENQPHNPEFRNNIENFHPCTIQSTPNDSMSTRPLDAFSNQKFVLRAIYHLLFACWVIFHTYVVVC